MQSPQSEPNIRAMRVQGVEWNMDNINATYSEELADEGQRMQFTENNGLLCYVDTEGSRFIAKATEGNRKRLAEAGYVESRELNVPFSSGEAAIEHEIGVRLESIREGVEGVLPPTAQEIVKGKLGVREIEDEEGIKRFVFKYEDKEFSFKSTEELPPLGNVDNSTVEIIGGDPKHKEEGEAQKYISNISTGEAKEPLLLTNNSPRGVLELLARLGHSTQETQQMLEEMSRGEFSDKTIELIDMMVAANQVMDIGKTYEVKKEPDKNGSALVVLALLGDEEAKKSIERKMEHLKDYDGRTAREVEEMERKRKELLETDIDRYADENWDLMGEQDRERRFEEERIRPEDLVVVHATKYEPAKNPDGSHSIQTSYDATGGKTTIRNSIHTALNHRVESHEGGSWDSAGYVIVSPFSDMMKENGTPAGINTVDTWWTRNPGEALRFPNTTIVRVVDEDAKDLIENGEQEILVKGSPYTIADLIKLMEMEEEEQSDSSLGRGLEQAMNFLNQNLNLEGQEYISISDEEFLQILLNQDPSNSIEFAISKILDESGARDRQREIAQEKLTGDVQSQIQGGLVRIATNRAIREKGGEAKPGGNYGWGGSMDASEKIGRLGRTMGLEGFSIHFYSPNHQMEEHLELLKKGKLQRGAFAHLSTKLDAKTRRVIYAEGLVE